MNYKGAWKFFYKIKLLKKQSVYRIKELSVVLLLFSHIIIQTNNLIHIQRLMKFQNKIYWNQIKAFSFLFCTTSDAKSTKGRKHLLYTE